MPTERIYHPVLDREIEVVVGLLGLSPEYATAGWIKAGDGAHRAPKTPAEPASTEPATEPDENKE